MSSSFFRPLFNLIFLLIFLVIFISCFFTPFLSNNLSFYEGLEISEFGFVWPTPEYTNINSYFGKRVSPTAGASSFHKGIDIGAPEGSPLVAVVDGEITFANFLGGGGYTITLASNDIKISYCHVSPYYLVTVRRFCSPRSNNWSCWTQKCLWSCSEIIIKMKMVILQMVLLPVLICI